MNLRYGMVLMILLAAACSSAPQPTATPTETPTLVATATDAPTLQPSATPSPEPSLSPTPTLIPVTIEPLLGEEIPPPLDIDLPSDWRSGSDSMLFQDVDGELRSVPVAVYTGPLTGGTGFIVLFWGFPNLVASAANNPDLDYVMWTEGLRLFRMAVVEEGCIPGTDLQMNFTIGGETASGTRFSIVSCPESPDARGWFAALRQGGGNFAFFNYIEPAGDINAPETLAAMNTGEAELQAILDTVRFRAPDNPGSTPTP